MDSMYAPMAMVRTGPAYTMSDGPGWMLMVGLSVPIWRGRQRYGAVIHLRTPPRDGGYNHQNPVRIESAAEAALVDRRIAHAWEGHPRRFVVESRADFMDKAHATIEILRGEMPECCRRHLVPAADRPAPGGAP